VATGTGIQYNYYELCMLTYYKTLMYKKCKIVENV